MSYNLTLECGCLVYVVCDPRTRMVQKRELERRGGACRHSGHQRGRRVYLWDLLPHRAVASSPAAPERIWA